MRGWSRRFDRACCIIGKIKPDPPPPGPGNTRGKKVEKNLPPPAAVCYIIMYLSRRARPAIQLSRREIAGQARNDEIDFNHIGDPKMMPKEQHAFLSERHAEAVRYMDNAEETLKRAGKQDNRYYKDEKYVKSACGIAHLGVLVALDAWLAFKDVPEPKKKQRKSIGFYTDAIAKLDHKLLSVLQTEYEIVHLCGYYDGMLSIKAIDLGFEAAYEIIGKIKPAAPRPTSRKPAAARARGR
ncbi:hypothetical protein R80B4_02456 [Fibrobacteres bacterium R8-0-B4]